VFPTLRRQYAPSAKLNSPQRDRNRRRLGDHHETFSPRVPQNLRRWFDYSRARDEMFDATDTPLAPWYIVRSDDKKRARLNCIRRLLSQIPYESLPREELPKRSMKHAYDDQATLLRRRCVPECTEAEQDKSRRIIP
jgi:hypothetical protein